MKATLTSKGQVTIPQAIRTRLGLRTGDVLEFDEDAPYLKATRPIPDGAWEVVGQGWKDPFPGQSADQALDELRGPVALPPTRGRRRAHRP